MRPLARRSFLAAGGAVLGLAAVQRPSIARALDALDTPDIPIATGSGVGTLPAPAGPFFDIRDFGAVSDGPALANQAAIHDAIAAAVQASGGTVVIPAGTYKTYTIRLASNVGLHLASPDTVLRAAVPGTGTGQDGGYYDAAETNPFIGLQDQGHSHFRNSLIVGVDVHDVMISGPGLIDGSYLDDTGTIVTVLTESDPSEFTVRTAAGKPGGANKAIALLNSRDIILRDFKMKFGGHFAILGTELTNWTIDGLIVDTNRDGIDIDSSRNVTVRNSTFNTIRDDAIVLKSSFATGKFTPTANVLVENCTVSGYDTGTVLAGVYGTEQLGVDVGPIGRIKLGTESTGGFDTVTIRNVTFDRSRGFALETVDGAELKNIVFLNATMRNVSASPIFIIAGDRGRIPVTGITTDESTSPANSVRLDNRGWILPNISSYGTFPPARYIPSYDRSQVTTIGGGANLRVAKASAPTRLNPASVRPDDPLYANAVGRGVAALKNVRIQNVQITDADPRFPIIISGLIDSPVENVSISNVTVEYRGGLTMKDAVEQRQLTIQHSFTSYQRTRRTEGLAWTASYGDADELMLPRIGWDPRANGGNGAWVDDPYNVPEVPVAYPEPGMYGILPAYGLWARHVRGLSVKNVQFRYRIDDERPPVVLDDVRNARFVAFSAKAKPGTPQFVFVTHTKKRDSWLELVPNQPYRATSVNEVVTPPGAGIERVTLTRPAPGTPPDDLYSYPTAPTTTSPYAYDIPNSDFTMPSTVFPDLSRG